MITLSYQGQADLGLGGAGGPSRLWTTPNLTLQTGENVATGEATLKISLPGSETVTTDQVSALLDSLAASCPDNQFAPAVPEQRPARPWARAFCRREPGGKSVFCPGR